MRLGGIADYLVDIHDASELKEAYAWAKAKQLPMIMIGGGSNIFWQDSGYHGLVLVNKITGYQDLIEGDGRHRIVVGAGENWDSVVARTTASGLTGIEALSLIPGTAGGTPVQNVGAYGQRISSVLTDVEVFDTLSGEIAHLRTESCDFGYRSSIFKTTAKGRYFIIAITLHLSVGNPLPPFYNAVQEFLERSPSNQAITPGVLRDIVIAIRRQKLPDPSVVPNNGSFFANPVVNGDDATRLQTQFPALPCWPGDDGAYKIPAAWLIESVGYKGFHDQDTGMATWENHALVLVNENAKGTADLLAFKQKIVDAVNAKFHITLQQEPELLP